MSGSAPPRGTSGRSCVSSEVSTTDSTCDKRVERAVRTYIRQEGCFEERTQLLPQNSPYPTHSGWRNWSSHPPSPREDQNQDGDDSEPIKPLKRLQSLVLTRSLSVPFDRDESPNALVMPGCQGGRSTDLESKQLDTKNPSEPIGHNSSLEEESSWSDKEYKRVDGSTK